MKKIKNLSILILSFLIILINKNVYAGTGTVLGNNVRLREDSSTKAEIIINMKKGEQVEIIEEKDNFYKVKYKEFIGYASKEYIQPDETQTLAKTETQEPIQEEQPQENTEPVTENVSKENEATNQENTISEDKIESLEGKDLATINNSNLRLKPNSASKVIVQIPANTNLKINKQLGIWLQVSYDNKTGWINKNYFQTENVNPIEEVPAEPETTEENKPEEVQQQPETEKLSSGISVGTKGYVNADTVNVREGASTESKKIGILNLNDEIEIIGEENDWYKIKTKEHGECYIAKRLISLNKITSRGTTFERDALVSDEANSALTSILTQPSNSGNEIVNFAMQYKGYSYVYGGKKPETGFDCSGFTKYVFENFGIMLGGTAASQANSGTEVAREDLQPGDLILFQNDARTCIGHCAIYIGNNTFVHAANPKRGVVTDVLDGNSYYSPRFVTARRF